MIAADAYNNDPIGIKNDFQVTAFGSMIICMIRNGLAILFAFFSFSSSIYAQDKCTEVENEEAVKYYEKGTDRKKYKKEERVKFLEQALELDPNYVPANFAYGKEIITTASLNRTPYKPAEAYLLKVTERCPKYHSDPYYYLGFSYYEQEKYEDAVKYLKLFIDFSDDDDTKFSKGYENLLYQAKEMYKYSKAFSELLKKPVPFSPQAVKDISSDKDEYLAIISPDDDMILFTRRMAYQNKDRVFASDKEVEVFSYSKRNKAGNFDKGMPMPPPFNKNPNEGGPTLSIDNKHLFYTISKDEGGPQPNADIYTSDFVEGEWTEIENLGKTVNDPVYWDSQPSLAADGKTLYFASDRPGGFGGVDLYKTVKDPATKQWTKPVNLGPKINTDGNEKSPFMHSDSETLYFCSDGHPGVGGFDIFYTRKDEKGEWKEPTNIGYPINTDADDLSFFVSTNGKYGYFASNNTSKLNGVGGWDVYAFELYKEARPDNVVFIRGELKDDKGQPVQAIVEIKNVKTKEKTDVVLDTLSGNYAAVVNLKKNQDVIITVKKDGHAFTSQVVSLKNTAESSKPVKVNLEVKPVEKGTAYTLNNIYFETNSSEVKGESRIVLEEFAEFLKSNTGIKIEIRGHTDNVGDDDKNMALSYERAQAVKEIIEGFDVQGSRISFTGKGEMLPVASNDTEEGRAKNRRTEFVVLEK